MKKHNVNTVNQTFSLPQDVCEELHAYVKRRERSHFVAEAIKKEIESKKSELRNAYLKSNEDLGQKETSGDWEQTVVDSGDDW